jgi:hypothetical protein
VKIIPFLMLLLLLSCGENSGNGNGVDTTGNPETARPSICSELGLKCFGLAEWTISSNAVNFPEKFQVLLDDNVVFDTCQFPDSLRTINRGGRTHIEFTLPLIPESILKVGIVNCVINAVFYSEDDVVFETGLGEKEDYSVFVTLRN